MTMFSNDMRVANTASPSFQSEANVTQFGWTGADQGHYNQLIQYVDECRKIWINLEERIDYVEEIIKTVEGIDAQVQYINLVASEISQWRVEILAARDQVNTTLQHVMPLYDQFNIDYADFSKKYTLVVQMHSETLDAAMAAATSEIGAKDWHDKAYDLYLDLKEGQVYQGTWDPTTGAFPAVPTTNSVWDVTLPTGTSSAVVGGFTWRSGDRLLYILAGAKWDQLATGGGVDSVNGKTGAITLDAADVGAAPAGFGLGGEGTNWGDKSVDDINASGFYSIYSSTTGTPYGSGGPSGSQLIHARWGGGAGASQMFFSYTANRVHFRRRYQSVWEPWLELYHTGKKPTPSELGALNKAGDTMAGEFGLGGPMILGKNLIKGDNNGVVLRDHGNGNVTLSAGVDPSGNAGTLYLGYNAVLAGTAGYNTRDIRIEVPTTWKGGHNLINADGLLNSEKLTGPIRTEKDENGITHTVVGGTDTINRGRTIVVGGECGKVIADNTTTGAETLHLGGDGTDGVYIHNGLQNGWGGSTHYRYQFRSGDLSIQKMDGTQAHKFYHEGYKPTAADVGALGNAGTQTLAGSLLVNPGTFSDPISMTQTFNPAGANAQGIAGYNSTDTKKRAWGVGAYSNNAVVDYSYLGVGDAPWANGLRVYADRAMFNQKLDIGSQLTLSNAGTEAILLNYVDGGEGSHIRGKEGGNNDWYVGRANTSGHVALYSNKLGNGLVIRDDYIESVKQLRIGAGGIVFATQALGEVDLDTLNATVNHGMYYQDATSRATPARHYPLQEAGSLIVMGSAHGAQQEFTTYNSNRKFVRGKINATTWLPWTEIGGPKHHLSGYRMQTAVIAAGGFGLMIPQVFPSNFGIDSAGGSGIFNIHKTATYEISFGFSIEPTGANQQGIGTILVNDAVRFDALNYNYCPSSGTAAGQATQMGISSVSVIALLTAGDKLKFRIQAVNGTSVRLYQSGHITIKELYS